MFLVRQGITQLIITKGKKLPFSGKTCLKLKEYYSVKQGKTREIPEEDFKVYLRRHEKCSWYEVIPGSFIDECFPLTRDCARTSSFYFEETTRYNTEFARGKER